MTSQLALWNSAELQELSWSRLGSLVSPSVTRETNEASMTSVFCGRNSFGLSGIFAQSTSSSKMSLTYCEYKKDSFGLEFSMIYPRWGMLSSGGLYQQAPLALHTAATDSLLLPTPTAYERATVGNQEPYITKTGTVRTRGKGGKSSNMGLRAYVQMYPTPRASMANGAHHNSAGVKGRGKPRLEEVLYPTPIATDKDGAHHNTKKQKRKQEGYSSHLRDFLYPEGANGTIYPHPGFVETLMGYPTGWTDLNR